MLEYINFLLDFEILGKALNGFETLERNNECEICNIYNIKRIEVKYLKIKCKICNNCFKKILGLK